MSCFYAKITQDPTKKLVKCLFLLWIEEGKPLLINPDLQTLKIVKFLGPYILLYLWQKALARLSCKFPIATARKFSKITSMTFATRWQHADTSRRQ